MMLGCLKVKDSLQQHPMYFTPCPLAEEVSEKLNSVSDAAVNRCPDRALDVPKHHPSVSLGRDVHEYTDMHSCTNRRQEKGNIQAL